MPDADKLTPASPDILVGQIFNRSCAKHSKHDVYSLVDAA